MKRAEREKSFLTFCFSAFPLSQLHGGVYVTESVHTNAPELSTSYKAGALEPRLLEVALQRLLQGLVASENGSSVDDWSSDEWVAALARAPEMLAAVVVDAMAAGPNICAKHFPGVPFFTDWWHERKAFGKQLRKVVEKRGRLLERFH